MIILTTSKYDLSSRWSLSSPKSGTPRRNRILLWVERLEWGGPCLYVETEMNGDPKEYKWTDFLGLVVCRYKRFLSCLGWSIVGPVQNIFPSPYTISIHLSPISQQTGQAVVLVHLSPSFTVHWFKYGFAHKNEVSDQNLQNDKVTVSCTVQCTYEMGLFLFFAKYIFLFIPYFRTR